MKKGSAAGIESILAEIRDQLRALTERVDRLEQKSPPAPVPERAETASPRPEAQEAQPEPIPEEDLLAISAALAAHFGVRVRARRIRLISSPAWAQQGRVSIQASHRLTH